MDIQIRNIIFDWGGVLIDLNTEGCMRAFEQLGADVKHLLTGTNELGVFSAYESGTLDTPGFHEAIRQMIGPPVSDEEIDKAWNTQLKSIPEEKLELLLRLKARYNLYLLSNNNGISMVRCRQIFEEAGLPMEKVFRKQYLSYEMKMLKPSPQIYRAVIEDIGLSQDEMLFIDDSVSNIAAAASLGIHAVQYVPGADLRTAVNAGLEGNGKC